MMTPERQLINPFFLGGRDIIISYPANTMAHKDKLKKELVDSGKMTYKQFHEAVMKENNMPVEMVRATLTNQFLQRDFKTKWKFYNFK